MRMVENTIVGLFQLHFALLETSCPRPMSHFCSQQGDHRGEDLVWPLGHSYLRQPKIQ